MIGIYFLLKDKEIVYVGQSIDIDRRIKDHSYNGKDFDSFEYIECDKSDLTRLETLYIVKFQPMLNKIIPLYGAKELYVNDMSMKNVKLTDEAHKMLKIYCANNECTMSEAIIKLLKGE